MTIYEALANAYKEVRDVQRERSQGVNYAYIGNEGLISAIRPAFEKHDIVMYPAGIEDVRHEEYQTSGERPKTMHRTTFTAKYVFAHKDGSYIETYVRGESADTSDKSTAQTMTMAFKTALRQTMMVSGDQDPDSQKQDMGSRRNTNSGASQERRQSPEQSPVDLSVIKQEIEDKAITWDELADALGCQPNQRAISLAVQAWAIEKKATGDINKGVVVWAITELQRRASKEEAE